MLGSVKKRGNLGRIVQEDENYICFQATQDNGGDTLFKVDENSNENSLFAD